MGKPMRILHTLVTKCTAEGQEQPGFYVKEGKAYAICGQGVLRVVQFELDGMAMSAAEFAAKYGTDNSSCKLFPPPGEAEVRNSIVKEIKMKKVLILGVNGFIGHHLSNRILATTDWEVYGMDMSTDRISDLIGKPRFHFFEGDITINKEWVEYHVKKCDVILPLVAIATPATYVKQPLRVFELDFEANLPIVRACGQVRQASGVPLDFGSVRHVPRRGIRPGRIRADLRPDQQAALDLFLLQAADGPRDLGLRHGRSELHAVPPVQLDRRRVSIRSIRRRKAARAWSRSSSATSCAARTSAWWTAAHQKRAFTYIDDGIAALMKIIENKNGIATGKIYNIGNPTNNFAIRDLADMMLKLAKEYAEYRDSAAEGEDRRNDFRSVLRQGLSGRAEPRAQDHQHLRGTGLEADHQHGRHIAQYLRCVSRPGGGSARPRGLIYTLSRADAHPSPASGRGAGGEG